MGVSESAVDLDRTLRERFGLERFRPGQREVIAEVVRERDVLCVMPTGGGKSLCYQLPALLLEGLTLVVSPLIALMKDQVDALTQRGIRATLINSTLDPSEQRLRLIEIEAGRYELVYVAPERFRSPRFVEAMARVRPALLAVDEAHCISEWGHDFRPDYAKIGQARRRLNMPPCIALTATATDLVRRDIADQLDLREPAQFITGFDRPNLSYHVIEARRDPDKLAAVAETLRREPGPSIIYASSRARCEAVGQYLGRELRREAVVYHAGLTREERTTAQERFMGGDAEVVVATNAFGMGVDKADIRSVIHFNLPGTLEAYYQEAGRAGRDGQHARCVLLYAPGDRFLQELFIENEYPPPDAVYRVYESLRVLDADPIELTQAEIRETARVEVPEQAVGTALKILEGAGALERFRPRENMAIVRINAEADEPSLVDRLGPQAHIQRTVLIGLEGLVNRRFAEPIYFHPDEFAAALGLDRTALSRALRNLTADLPIDYIPPFRGNAVRIIDRNRKARDLVIDFSALHKRKQQEYDKLERMIKYAQTSRCRRSYILGYFGDAESTGCGLCDNCDEPDGSVPASAPPASTIDSDAGREVILKVLSGVARAKGRFGKTTVAQMLTGSGAEKMDRWGLKRLTTFGILSDFKQPEVVQILDALAAAGLVESEDVELDFKPVITLTESGWALLRGQSQGPIDLALPAELSAKVRFGGLMRLSRPTPPRPASSLPAAPSEPAGPPDGAAGEPPSPAHVDSLKERLWRLRSDWARQANMSPGYLFTNETLEAIARERPRTPHALASIKGIGPAKLERYGAALLEAIASAAPAPPTTSPVPGPRSEEADPFLPLPPGEGRGEGASSAGALAPTLPQRGREPEHSSPTQGAKIDLGEDDSRTPEDARLVSYVPTEEWTWRLLDRGFTPEEAAAIRGLEPSAILRHATWVARRGKPIPLEAFLDPEVIGRWDAWRRENGDEPPPSEPVGLWQLYLACRPSTKHGGSA